MTTNTYITPEIILSTVQGMVGDTKGLLLPKGVYISAVQKALEDLSLESFFAVKHESFDFPNDTLTLEMPRGCFNIKNIYLFSGSECIIGQSRKVYWKRNYYTQGNGYVANDKVNNVPDPFFGSHGQGFRSRQPNGINNHLGGTVNGDIGNLLYYNIQMGDIMFSSSCRGKGNRIMIEYNHTFTDIGDAPIIPIIFRAYVEDYVCEYVLRMMGANDPAKLKLWQIYDMRLNKLYDGSKARAIQTALSMNSSQRQELAIYYSRGQWSEGL
jgi:hypothetical protein